MGAAQGSATPAVSVLPGEKLWRLIEHGQYRPNAQGALVVQEAAFIGEVSLLRPAVGVTEQYVDAISKFMKYGIAEMDADEILKNTGGSFRVTPDPDWPTDGHVLFIRKTGGKNLAATHLEVPAITDIANAKALLRLPKP
jgi:hypothetical protein